MRLGEVDFGFDGVLQYHRSVQIHDAPDYDVPALENVRRKDIPLFLVQLHVPSPLSEDSFCTLVHLASLVGFFEAFGMAQSQHQLST